jgi:hypothetical protein
MALLQDIRNCEEPIKQAMQAGNDAKVGELQPTLLVLTFNNQVEEHWNTLKATFLRAKQEMFAHLQEEEEIIPTLLKNNFKREEEDPIVQVRVLFPSYCLSYPTCICKCTAHRAVSEWRGRQDDDVLDILPRQDMGTSRVLGAIHSGAAWSPCLDHDAIVSDCSICQYDASSLQNEDPIHYNLHVRTCANFESVIQLDAPLLQQLQAFDR